MYMQTNILHGYNQIQLNWEYFANHHVYPYTYYGGYLYRNRFYKEALLQWAKAADVISRYFHNID